ncbi:MAG: hypothetical protein GY809_16100, partial [Planctomycetes bacterium]|nr:hypothetical protein [Planctomycetota bacterium]
KVQHSLVQGTLDVKSVDIQGTFIIYAGRPNRFYARFYVDTMGILERGCNGTVYWEKSSASGARIFKGDTLKMNVLLAHFDLLYYDQLYRELKYKQVSEVDGEPCHEVELVPPDCAPVTMHFSQATGLPVQQDFIMPSMFQPIPVTNTIMAYKTFDGQQMPALLVQKVRGMETHRTVRSVELNGVLPKGIFDLPEEIKALVQERAALDANDVDPGSSPESGATDTPSGENDG